jgi:hypothetical protein
VCAPDYGGSVDVVGCVESQDIALFPIPEGFETFSEIEGSVANLGISVGTRGVGIGIDYCCRGRG